MAWELIGKPATKRITAALAKEFAEMEAPPHDRALNERRLQVYERMAMSGGFRPVSWAKCFCKETGTAYRVNGKHTSTLFSRLSPLPELYAVIEEFTCDELEDLAKLYSTFDSRTQTRTANDIYMAFAASIPEIAAVPKRVITACVSGMAFSRWHGGYAQIPTAERAELLFDEPDFVLFAAEILGGGQNSTSHMTRVPVVAAIHGCWKKSAAKAREFWVAVREETGPSPTLPDRKLAKWLSSNTVNNGAGATDGKPQSRRADFREFYVRCIHAWNAWRKGESTDLKYFKDAKIPAFS